MRAVMTCLVIGLPCGGVAQEAVWTPMTGAQITEALTGQVIEYGDIWQDFRASGRTLYVTSEESWGYWGVRGDQYCSMWPPSDLWVCYDMARSGAQIRFIGEAGDISEGVLRAELE